MGNKFIKVVGLANAFTIDGDGHIITTALKSGFASTLRNEALIFLTATAAEDGLTINIGTNTGYETTVHTGDAFIWGKGVIYDASPAHTKVENETLILI